MISASNHRSSDSRKVTIQITGLCRQDIKRRSNYAITVSYGRLSRIIQQIQQTGAKIASISLQYSDIQQEELALSEPIVPAFQGKMSKGVRRQSSRLTKTMQKNRGKKSRQKSKMYIL